MDDQRFDRLVRQLAGARSRRSLLKGLIGTAIAGAIGTSRGNDAAADKGVDDDRDENNGLGCKRAGKNCKTDGQCCAGLICPDETSCAAGCRIDGIAHTPGPDPNNACQACVPEVSTGAWTPVAAGVPCEDGNLCTVSDACNGAGLCVGTPKSCPGDQCNQGVCRASDGECVLEPLTGALCDDGNACTAGDTCKSDGTCVGQLLAPTISCPADQNVTSGAGICGAVVTYSATATCADVSCNHPSGSSFPIGTTEVQCGAGNDAGGTVCSFTVTVTDGENPDISCPADISQPAPAGAPGVAVNYVVTATDNCTPVDVSCSTPTGSAFSIGTTAVTCTATDPNGRQDICGFNVTVVCTPNCPSGVPCGADDGCGGHCDGFCPDNTTDFCRDRSGTCNPSTGCSYALEPAGTLCGNFSDLCNAERCTAGGACAPAPVTCADTECQECDSFTGTCYSVNEGKACGDSRGLCTNGSCESPCGDACANYCYANVDDEGDVIQNSYFCCPAEARGPGGFCCWVNNQPGIITADGVCTSQRQVCADGQACDTECCGASDYGHAGSCPGSNQYCVDGALVTAGTICTTNADCAAYGGSAVCAGLEYVEDSDNTYVPVPGSGTCCPAGYYGAAEFPAGGPVYTCCSPGSMVGPTTNDECCGYPYYTNGCTNCFCSFRVISRCCT